jgi:hypothetical protein
MDLWINKKKPNIKNFKLDEIIWILAVTIWTEFPINIALKKFIDILIININETSITINKVDLSSRFITLSQNISFSINILNKKKIAKNIRIFFKKKFIIFFFIIFFLDDKYFIIWLFIDKSKKIKIFSKTKSPVKKLNSTLSKKK